jgi:hypothetical protein
VLLTGTRTFFFFGLGALQECPSRQMSCYFEAWHECDERHVDGFREGAFHVKVCGHIHIYIVG